MTQTAIVPVTTWRPELLPRLAGIAGACCLSAHSVLVVAAGAAMLSMTAPMLALSALCSACALRAWRRRWTAAELTLVVAVGVLMVGLHLHGMPHPAAAEAGHAMMPMPGMAMPGTAAESGSATSATGVSRFCDLLMHLGVTFAAAAALLAAVALVRRARHAARAVRD